MVLHPVVQVCSKLERLLRDIHVERCANSRSQKLSLLRLCRRVISHYYTVAEYITTEGWLMTRNYLKLLSVLYNIFTQLVTKVIKSPLAIGSW